jgi:hypothetical protein
MSRITDLTAAAEIARHCTDPRCRKCRVRSHWHRRKAWQTGQTPARKSNGKDVMPR